MALAAYGSFQNATDGGAASTLTALQPILKEFYGPQQIKNLVYKRNKWLAMLHKEEDWSGLVVPIPVVYGNPQGASADFSAAKQNVTSTSSTRFIMQWAQDYAFATITNLVNLASRNDAGAFLKAVQTEMNGALRSAENRLAGGLFRSRTGTIGAGTESGGTVTFTNVMDITQIEKGMVLEASSTDGGAALGTTTRFGCVQTVNRTAGTFTVTPTSAGSSGFGAVGTGAAGTPNGWTGTMYFRISGDNLLAGSGDKRVYGLADWLPTTVSGGENFNNVDRSVDRTRLAGIYWDGSAQTIEEALIDAAAVCAREDGNPEICMTNHLTFAALEKSLGSKVNYVNYQHEDAAVGFQGIRIHGADAEINVFADRSCQGKRAYLLDPDSWVLGSMKPCPHILTELDGLTELRDPNADAVQIRIGSYAIHACDAPGSNGLVATQV